MQRWSKVESATGVGADRRFWPCPFLLWLLLSSLFTKDHLTLTLSLSSSPKHTDQNELRQAHELLEQFSQTNLVSFGCSFCIFSLLTHVALAPACCSQPEYLKTLSDVLANQEQNGYVRMAAGLQLKNQLTSKDDAVRARLTQQWLTLSEEIRNAVKVNTLRSLGTETGRPSASSQCIAYIAAIELPHNLWPSLIRTLTENATRRENNEQVKVANLEAIGYICQEVHPELLISESNQILTAIINNMGKDEQSTNVRLTATNALLNSLEFTKANFDTEQERHFIMQVVCEATQCSDIRVSVLVGFALCSPF